MVLFLTQLIFPQLSFDIKGKRGSFPQKLIFDYTSLYNHDSVSWMRISIFPTSCWSAHESYFLSSTPTSPKKDIDWKPKGRSTWRIWHIDISSIIDFVYHYFGSCASFFPVYGSMKHTSRQKLYFSFVTEHTWLIWNTRGDDTTDSVDEYHVIMNSS